MLAAIVVPAFRGLWLGSLTSLACATGGCSDDAVCVTPAASDCAPLYNPTYSQVFERTLKPTCALPGGACHSGPSAKAGLRMDDADQAYELLVEGGRLIPGDAACSLLVVRLEGGGDGVMPPGAQLSEAERCAIETWVANGAVK